MWFRKVVLIAAATGLAAAAPGHAWNDFGHELIARIAWQELEPEVRSRVLALFREAPRDSLMHCLDLNQDRRRGCGRFSYRLGDAPTAEDGDRILFERAAYWPDLARQLDKYNRPTWHYIGWTWRQGADGTAHDTDLPVPEPNAVSQLVELARSVADTSGRPDKRAIHLAWIFHLVGDIHQPLHAASRVTERRDEREGDRGGNGFGLDDWNRNLHAFWDGALDARFRADYQQQALATLTSDSNRPPPSERFWRAFGELRDREYETHKDRVAAEARSRHPFDDAVRASLKSGDFEAWARESNQIVRTSVYPADLTRGKAPPSAYADFAYDTSLRRAAIAGYRLADLLREMLGG
jgi:hypothetical protein